MSQTQVLSAIVRWKQQQGELIVFESKILTWTSSSSEHGSSNAGPGGSSWSLAFSDVKGTRFS
jgi:hypothetical protein